MSEPRRSDSDALKRDITALKHELAGIAIFMQERGRLSDPGGPLFALVHGAVVKYVLELERRLSEYADLLQPLRDSCPADVPLARWIEELLYTAHLVEQLGRKKRAERQP